MTRHTITKLGSIAAAGLLLFGAIGVASAADATATPTTDAARCAKPVLSAADHGVGALRAFGDCEIDHRLTVLGQLSSRVSGSTTLTDADRSALSSEISSTVSGLTALRGTIDGEANVDALKADIRTIVTDYRVYVLVTPKTGLVIAADTLQVGYTKFDSVEQRLAAALATAKAAGKDTTKAQADYDAMTAAVNQAETLLHPVVGTIIGLTPADYNAGTAHPALADARTTLRQVRGLFAQARTDARACRADLVALRG